MSTAVAQNYLKKMLESDGASWGNMRNALERIERRYGIPYWTLNNLRIGRAKTVEAGLFQRLRGAYLDHCQRQIDRLKHEIEIESARHNALDADLLGEIESLAAKIKASKGR